MAGKVRCPGSMKSTAPEIIERDCPKCGNTVEMFADEEKTDCKCGNTVFKSKVPTCVEWCSAAEECLGDVIDVKKVKAEAKKRAVAEGADLEFTSRLTDMIKDKSGKK
ncbi:MAG: hypothetical protein V3W00_04400 [Candidatus Brocadiales bacterium]|jgi:hypothetical protein